MMLRSIIEHDLRQQSTSYMPHNCAIMHHIEYTDAIVHHYVEPDQTTSGARICVSLSAVARAFQPVSWFM